jgi:hypothetical protein
MAITVKAEAEEQVVLAEVMVVVVVQELLS